MNLLPKVFRTEGDMVEFDASKIFNSIIAETGMEEEKAKLITELVVRRIISSGIRFLSGPHIREIVCSILSENHFEKERKLYTRIGMPLMDYEEILEFGLKKEDVKVINPEKIHHWAANKLAEEYCLLRILNDEESEAHLYGDIYIHQLKYFDLRPYSQVWDPRFILVNGLPSVLNSTNSYKSVAPKDLQEAIIMLTNWFGIIQGEFCGSQVYDFLNIFLAPFAQNLDYKTISYIVKNYIIQLNYISMILGKSYLKSSVFCSPFVTESLKNLPAIGPGGEIRGVYGDYEESSIDLFKAFIDAFSQHNFIYNHYKLPLLMIYFKTNWLHKLEELYSHIFNKITTSYSPIFVNMSSESYNQNLRLIKADQYFSHGILQKVSINLPRIAYLSKKEDTFIEILHEKLELCFSILKKKQEIIQKRLNTKHLPLCSASVGDKLVYNFNLQDLCIGFVGLNEAVKMITNSELHQSDDSLTYGKKIISYMNNFCMEKTKKEAINYSLIENLSNSAIKRFLKLDIKHFPNIPILRKKVDLNEFIYSNSTHFNINSTLKIKEILSKQSQFHSLIKYNAHEKIGIKKEKKELSSTLDFIELLEFVNSNTKINKIKFFLEKIY